MIATDTLKSLYNNADSTEYTRDQITLHTLALGLDIKCKPSTNLTAILSKKADAMRSADAQRTRSEHPTGNAPSIAEYTEATPTPSEAARLLLAQAALHATATLTPETSTATTRKERKRISKRRNIMSRRKVSVMGVDPDSGKILARILPLAGSVIATPEREGAYSWRIVDGCAEIDAEGTITTEPLDPSHPLRLLRG